MASDTLAFSLAMNGLWNILLVLVCVAFSWWGLQQVRLEVFLKHPKSAQAKLLLIFVSLALGYTVASFLSAYFSWSGVLKGLV